MADRRIWRLAAAAAALVAAGAAGEAAAQVSGVLELGGARLSVTPAEMKALTELGAALRRPGGIQESLLADARRTARSPDALHWLALLELELGRRRKDEAMRAAALDRLIASPLTGREKLAEFLDVRGGIALRAGDLAAARTHWSRLLKLRPGDPDVLGNLAQVEAAEGDEEDAAGLLGRSLAEREKSGARASADAYRQRLIILQTGPVGEAAAAGQALVAAYPTAQNWRDALVIYRQLAAPSGGMEIDLLRLMRAVGALARADEYVRMAQLLAQAGQAAEAGAVLAEGRSRGLVDPATSPAREIAAAIERALPKERASLAAAAPSPDSLAGAGRDAEAEAGYRAALPAGAGDPGELNTRLGAVLLRAGKRAEAKAAFEAAANSPRYGEIAKFWLLWLAQTRP